MIDVQWEQDRPGAYHVRRRVTAEEMLIVGDVADLRGTAEGIARYEAALPFLPAPAIGIAREEIGL